MVVITGGREGDRNPEFSLIGPVEFRTHDADNTIRALIENDGTANDVRVSGKALLPGLMRQHGNQASARLILFRRKGATEGGPHLEHIEVAGGNPRTLHQFGVGVVAAEVEAAAEHDGSVGEDVLAFGGIGKIRRRQRYIG